LLALQQDQDPAGLPLPRLHANCADA
jgi:hypothetical protein